MASNPTSEISESSTDSHIDIQGLTKTFDSGKVIAIEDIDLQIKENEILVLLGPSGCGKTTTLRCIAGLNIPDAGTIEIGGEDVTKNKPKDRDLAYVFQNIALFPHMSVRKNIRFGLDMTTGLSKAEKKDRVEEAASILGIDGLLDRNPGDLSGGQQQRVSLGRAMVMDPVAFLLDEPFSALDANLRDRMRVEIKKLQRKLGTAMVFVTHDQEEAMTIGDRIAVMNNGSIQQIGAPPEVYNEPANLFIAEFIGSPSTNLVDVTLRQQGEQWKFVNDFLEIELSAEGATRLSDNEEAEVTIGIRPEYLQLNDPTRDFTAEVDVIENHGSRDAVFLSVDGVELTAMTSQSLIDPTRDAEVDVSLDTDHIWVFDQAGQRLL